MNRYTTIFLLSIILLWFSCANQVTPSGGPKDETPPSLVRSTPLEGALKVPQDQEIKLYFSEWLDVKAAEKSLNIFPFLKKGYRLDVYGKRITISPVEPLDDSTTYHITLTNTLTDAHGVKIKIPYNLVFSTGPTINKCKVFGCIIDEKLGKKQPKVALYRHRDSIFNDSTFLSFPDYLTQTDSFGLFSFSHIKAGTYELLAFDDKDNNNRLTPQEEAYAPEKRTIHLDSTIGPLHLYTMNSDTTVHKVKKVKAINPRLIQLTWGSSYEKYDELFNHNWQIISYDSTIKNPQISDIVHIPQSTYSYVKLRDSLTTGSYALAYILEKRVDQFPDTIIGDDTIAYIKGLYNDTIRFNGTRDYDTTSATLERITPTNIAMVEPKITLVWSKPMRYTGGTVYLSDTVGGVQVGINTKREHQINTVFSVTRPLKAGTFYKGTIPITLFEDLNGNNPTLKKKPAKKDTLSDTTNREDSLIISFTTIEESDLCPSLSGCAPCFKEKTNLRWSLDHLKIRDAQFTVNDSFGCFTFKNIPAGKTLVKVFVDHNYDGKHSNGRIFPWQTPEPKYHFTNDTLVAKARWDIEGITLEDCISCKEAPLTAIVDTTGKLSKDSTEVKE